jgi:urease accessory protein
MPTPDPPEDSTWLTLLQLHDSAFPIGAFAHSNGLERYADLGMTPDGLRAWLLGQLRYGFGRLDLAALVLAYRQEDAEAESALRSLACELDAWKSVPTLRATSLSLGRRTLTLARRVWPEAARAVALTPETCHHALVVGRLSRALGLPLRASALAFTRGAVAAATSAATRCLPLGPERAQALMRELHDEVSAAVARVLADPAASLWSATPAAELRAAEQPSLASRMFES